LQEAVAHRAAHKECLHGCSLVIPSVHEAPEQGCDGLKTPGMHRMAAQKTGMAHA